MKSSGSGGSFNKTKLDKERYKLLVREIVSKTITVQSKNEACLGAVVLAGMPLITGLFGQA